MNKPIFSHSKNNCFALSIKLLLSISLLNVNVKAFTQQPLPKLPKSKHSFVVIAHRGDHTNSPENTLAAFKDGITNGVDYLEIDLRTTKDSMLVIMHDATVDKMTNGKGKISEMTYDEVRRLHITDKKDSAKKYLIPNFEEVLSTCQNKICIYLDFKDASVTQAYKMIKQYGMENQLIVYINSYPQYMEWKKVAPEIPLMVSLPDNIKTSSELIAFLKKTPVSLLDGGYENYNQDMIAVANSAGVVVWPDIQSAKEFNNWDKALETGFKGLQTDHPEALIEYLKKKGLR